MCQAQLLISWTMFAMWYGILVSPIIVLIAVSFSLHSLLNTFFLQFIPLLISLLFPSIFSYYFLTPVLPSVSLSTFSISLTTFSLYFLSVLTFLSTPTILSLHYFLRSHMFSVYFLFLFLLSLQFLPLLSLSIFTYYFLSLFSCTIFSINFSLYFLHFIFLFSASTFSILVGTFSIDLLDPISHLFLTPLYIFSPLSHTSFALFSKDRNKLKLENENQQRKVISETLKSENETETENEMDNRN